MVALVAFCLLTLASVGLLYLPAAAALVMAFDRRGRGGTLDTPADRRHRGR
jgi:hypothetical protein